MLSGTEVRPATMADVADIERIVRAAYGPYVARPRLFRQRAGLASLTGQLIDTRASEAEMVTQRRAGVVGPEHAALLQ
jgi:hypothetical protein